MLCFKNFRREESECGVMSGRISVRGGIYLGEIRHLLQILAVFEQVFRDE